MNFITNTLDYIRNGRLSEMFAKASEKADAQNNCINTRHLNQHQLMKLYREPLIQKVVNEIPEDCLAKDPEFVFTQNVNQEKLENDLNAIECFGRPLEMLNLKEAYVLAMKYARLTGGGFIFLDIDDNAPLESPVNFNNIRSIRRAIVKHRFDVALNPSNDTIVCYMRHDFSRTNGSFDMQGKAFHYSRVLRFSGTKNLLFDYTIDNYEPYHDYSIVEEFYKAFLNFSVPIRSIGDMVQNHSAFKYGMKGLDNVNFKNNQNHLLNRFINIIKGMQFTGGLIYDVDQETADFINRNYSGLNTVIDKLEDWLVANSQMTRTKLLGNARQSAMSNGANGDRDAWNEIILKNQTIQLDPNRAYLIKLILAMQGIQNANPRIENKPFYTLTEKEKAEIAEINSKTDLNYRDTILHRKEIRESRFGGNSYGTEIALTEIDLPEMETPVLPESNPENLSD